MQRKEPRLFRVLAVDPDGEMLTLYRDILCYEGDGPGMLEALFHDTPDQTPPPLQDLYSVQSCTAPETAMELFQRAMAEGTPFDLAIVELRFPDEAGILLAEAMRKLDSELELLFVSSSSEDSITELNRRVSPPDKLFYLQKPFRSGEFRQIATALCNKRDAEQQLHELNSRLTREVGLRTRDLNAANVRLKEDIAKRVEVLRKLKTSEERYRLLFEKDVTGNFAAAPDGSILKCNQAFADMFKFDTPEEALNFNVFDFWKEIGEPETLHDLLTHKPSLTNREIEYGTGANKRSLLANFEAVRTSEGVMTEVRGYFFDISQRKRLEEQLRMAQKMEALGTLAGGIAHDFNNILGVIMGYAEIIQSGADQNSPLDRRVTEILSAGKRARDLVNQILNFSRQQAQERQPLSLTPLVKEALKLLRSSIPSNIALDVQMLAGSDSILADPTQVHQILLNLCTNAAQAMLERGGSIMVSLHDVHDSDAILPPEECGKADWFVRLTVKDDGPGIEPAILERIFDPFFTTKKPGEGTGMGLSMVHGIVKRHEGFIAVESELGHGAEFHVFLPRTSTVERPELPPPPQLVFDKGRILFVDDEKPLVDIGKEMLESCGFDVVTRTSSIEALEAFKFRAEDFDLVITDQSMPNMTGMELAREILKIRPGTPIILCTGFSEAVSYERIRDIGIGDFIMKPILKHEIMDSIARLLGSQPHLQQ